MKHLQLKKNLYPLSEVLSHCDVRSFDGKLKKHVLKFGAVNLMKCFCAMFKNVMGWPNT